MRFALVIGVQQLFYSGNANIAAECIFVTEAAPSRRDEVARIAVELIVNGGLKAVTFRNLAKQLGCSTTVITHYFRDKDDVLLETYRYVNAQAAAMRNQALTGDRVSPAMAVEELLPIAEAQRRNWTVWLHYWTAALHSKPLAEEHARSLQRMYERMRKWLEGQGLKPPSALDGAQTICNALFGIAIQAIFDENQWSPARQRREIRRATQIALGLETQADSYAGLKQSNGRTTKNL